MKKKFLGQVGDLHMKAELGNASLREYIDSIRS